MKKTLFVGEDPRGIRRWQRLVEMRKRKAEQRRQNRRDLAASLDARYGRSRESASQSDAGSKTGQDQWEILTK